MSLWKRIGDALAIDGEKMRERFAHLMGELAFFFLAGIAFSAVVHIASHAPEFAAIVIAGALVALAIYKRPPTKVETRLVVHDMTVESLTADLDAAYAAKILDMLREAAKNLPEREDAR